MGYTHLFITSALALVMTGCTSRANGVQGTRLDALGFEGLKRGEYRILDKAQGDACGTYVGLWPIPIFFTSTPSESGDVFGAGLGGWVNDAALYRAIAAVPNADAILAPRFTSESNQVGIWYRKTCVTVRGKAVEVKGDDELTAPRAEPMAPSAPLPPPPKAHAAGDAAK